MNTVNRAVRYLCQALPERGRELRELADYLAARMPEFELRPTHMDMKSDHLFLGDRTWFIDLDSSAISDPVFDPAMFIARLDAQILESPTLSSRIVQLRDDFKASYFEQVPPARALRFGAHYARAAFKVALFFMQHLTTNWELRVADTLERAWGALDQQSV